MTAKWQYKQAYEGALEEVRSLKAENAMLRDLCDDMYRQCGESMGYDDPLLEEFGIGELRRYELCE